MKPITAIVTIACAIICISSIILVPVSQSFNLPDFADNGDIEPNASISIGSFHCAISRGRFWFFNADLPYSGSIIGLSGRERTDWSWGMGSYGIEQVSYIDAKGKVSGIARYGDLPGIYYRYFDSNKKLPWWTLAVSFLHLAVLSALLPSWWIIRRWKRLRHFSLRQLFIATTVVSMILGIAVWLYQFIRGSN